MALSSKERQQRWKQRQKDKQQVTAMLSKNAYEILKKEKELSSSNFSQVIEKALIASDERFKNILENSPDVIYRANLAKDTFDYISPSSKKILGYSPEDMISLGFRKTRVQIHPEDFKRMKKHFNIFKARSNKDIATTIEYRAKHKELGYRWMSHTRTVVFDQRNHPVAVVGNVRDITRLKQTEKELKKLHSGLEKKVKERTASMEEANTALKVLLRQMDKEKIALEEKILLNIKELIIPALARLHRTGLDSRQKNYLDIMESYINDIVSPFTKKLTSRYLDFTHGEIQVASLIMQGKTTKEIAQMLNLSNRTIDFHRARIRKKAGIKNIKANLRSYLLSLQ